MSLWNHYSNLTDAVFAKINDPGILFGDPAPRASEDIHAFWNDWINRGWFPWKSEGYPHSGNFYHTQSWWRFRHLENVLFVHFNDLLDDPCAEIARIADHLSIVVSDRALDKIVDATRFASIKINAAHAAPMRAAWPG